MSRRHVRLQGPLLCYVGGRRRVWLRGTCDFCGREGPLESFTAREWVCLGPLPLLPLGCHRVFDLCPHCRRHRRMPAGEYHDWALAESAADREALAARPADLAARLRLFWTWYGLGLHWEAAALLAPVRATGEAPAPVHHAAGAAMRALGRGEAARAAFEAAVAAAPDEPLYRYDLALCLLGQRGGAALAEPHLDHAVTLRPDDAEAWLALAEVRAALGRWQGARDAWERVAHLDPALAAPPLRQRQRRQAEAMAAKSTVTVRAG